MDREARLRAYCIKDKRGLSFFPVEAECEASEYYGISKRALLQELCSLGIMPERYFSNYSTYSIESQGILLSSRVGVIGMGGLGGCILEMLSRVGIGELVCADGDRFEGRNLNRQLFSSEAMLGVQKSIVGEERIHAISSITTVRSIDAFLDASDMRNLMADVDIVVDALGGLEYKGLLVDVAHTLGIPVVASSIAGLCGYVSYLPVGSRSATDWLGKHGGIEESLGNLPQTVFCASAYVVQFVTQVILRRLFRPKCILFDMETCRIEEVVL